jgi:hypothetical protein
MLIDRRKTNVRYETFDIVNLYDEMYLDFIHWVNMIFLPHVQVHENLKLNYSDLDIADLIMIFL